MSLIVGSSSRNRLYMNRVSGQVDTVQPFILFKSLFLCFRKKTEECETSFFFSLDNRKKSIA
jgi:hypothetical protein